MVGLNTNYGGDVGITTKEKNTSNVTFLQDKISSISCTPTLNVTASVIPGGDLNVLNEIRIKYVNNVIIGHLNINTLVNKFEYLKFITKGTLDILVVVETKLDTSFPDTQFVIEGYSKPYRLDRNIYGGGLIIYVKKDIPSKQLIQHKFSKKIEALFIELNLRKSKLLLVGTYHSTHPEYGTNDMEYFEQIGLAMDVYSKYENFLIAGDFNVQEEELSLQYFLHQYGAVNMVKENTCFKSKDNPSCIDLLLTNSNKSFHNTTTISTGLSDFHKMTITVMKTTFVKQKPRLILYRDYSKYSKDNCLLELERNMKKKEINEYETFENIFLNVLNKHAPFKKKIIRGNQKPYVTKRLRKAIMKRSFLENNFYKNSSTYNKRAYRKQKNFCNRLYKKERISYYSNLDMKKVTDNKKIWNTVKPLFTNKGGTKENITLVNEGKIITEDVQVAQTFNDFFDNAVNSMNIEEDKYLETDNIRLSDPVEIAIKKNENHPSIIKIKENIKNNKTFSFSEVNTNDIASEIKKLKTNKAGTFMNIPVKDLKQAANIISEPLMNIWNKEIVENKTFPTKLKLAEISPIFKKLDSILVNNYRPVSILPVVSKFFERIMQNQIEGFIEKHLSPYLCGYRKGYNAQYALTAMIEKWKLSIDNSGYAAGVLMDLSKAFDSINHQLLIAKLEGYGFEKTALAVILDYLSDRWQRTKINLSFSSWSELFKGVPQGSVLGPIFFNIFLNDLFYEFINTEACNLADDTTPYACDKTLEGIFYKLEQDTLSAIIWFKNNYMQLNQDKCHFLISGNTNEHLWTKVGEKMIWESSQEKLLGITIDKNLKFTKHLENICKKASAKVTALARLVKIIPFHKKRILMKTFIESQFSYCPLIWMFCTRKMNMRINHIQERALRLVYDDYITPFNDLLVKDKSVTIHHRNIQRVAVEMFKVKNDLCPEIGQIFKKSESIYNTRSNAFFSRPQTTTICMGEESLRSFGPIVWNHMLPHNLKLNLNLSKFKEEIKSWTPTNCPCKLCKEYIPNLGYVKLFS